jgi:hypothetical protein
MHAPNPGPRSFAHGYGGGGGVLPLGYGALLGGVAAFGCAASSFNFQGGRLEKVRLASESIINCNARQYNVILNLVTLNRSSSRSIRIIIVLPRPGRLLCTRRLHRE